MEDNTEFITQIIDQFSTWYAPATDIAKATDFLSTAEIAEALNQIHPGAKVNDEQIFDALSAAGYHYAPAPGKMTFQLTWMIIRNS